MPGVMHGVAAITIVLRLTDLLLSGCPVSSFSSSFQFSGRPGYASVAILSIWAANGGKRGGSADEGGVGTHRPPSAQAKADPPCQARTALALLLQLRRRRNMQAAGASAELFGENQLPKPTLIYKF